MPTRIESFDETWNPFGHGCWGPGGSAESPHRCSYCFAARMAKRKMSKCPQCQAFIPHFHPERLDEPLHWKRPRRVFVASMADPLAPWVSHEHLDRVLEVIGACPQHTFFMLTKWPQNIVRALYEVTEMDPLRSLGGGDYIPNLWIGVTADTDWRTWDACALMHKVSKLGWRTFASVEPMLTWISPDYLDWASWIIIGAQSGPGAAKHQPQRDWVEDMIGYADQRHVPIFLTSSITALWPDLVRKEWPKGG